MFKLDPTYVAASALVVIQAGVGLIYKLSQRDGVQVSRVSAQWSMKSNLLKAIPSQRPHP